MPTITDTVKADTAATRLGHRWGWLLALGIVQIVAGSIAIAVPVVASIAAVGIFGAVLLVTAALQLIHAFKVRAWPRSAWYGLGGVLYAIAGLLVVMYPLGGALTLAVMIAILFIADGTLRMVFGMTVRPVAGWGWLIAAGLCSIVVGVILLLGWPATAHAAHIRVRTTTAAANETAALLAVDKQGCHSGRQQRRQGVKYNFPTSIDPD